MALNEASLIGNVGRDPEIRTTTNGHRVASFSLATTEKWTVKGTGERREATEWHTIVVWNEGLVGVIEKYVRKGSKLFVRGKIKTRKYTTTDGQDRWTTEVVLETGGGAIELLGDPGGNRRPAADDPPASSAGRGGADPAALDDEVPF